MQSYPFQPIMDIAQICVAHRIEKAVLSPGSRNAPLTLAFVRNERIQCFTFSDERAAGFVALGMAQVSLSPVILCCTSGSAGLNYAPAVAEAFFQQIPLLVFTADRPPEWTDQLDGQTIRQRDLFGKHVKASYELPVDYTHPDAVWQINRLVNEAILTATAEPQGPVHINCPFREPFYPKKDDLIYTDNQVRYVQKFLLSKELAPHHSGFLLNSLEDSKKVLVVGGQNRCYPFIEQLFNELQVPVINDCINNLHYYEGGIKHHDIFLAKPEIQEQLGAVDFLITFDKSVLSKPLKNYLRKYKPKIHLHLQPEGVGALADTFQSITHLMDYHPIDTFRVLAEKKLKGHEARVEYGNLWRSFDKQAALAIDQFFSKPIRNNPFDLPLDLPSTVGNDNKTNALLDHNKFSELLAVYKILRSLSANCILHLANSMPVRYVNVLGVYPKEKQNMWVAANRGTSGIDGCISTAVGHALANRNMLHVLITGDIGFFYDRNALWNIYDLHNLRIILLNNHGGGIFKLIDSGKLPESDEFFVTEQWLNAENTARDFEVDYTLCRTYDELQTILPTFFEPSENCKLLEIETDLDSNQEVWEEFKKL